MKTQEEWQRAKEYLDEVIGEYDDLRNMPGVNVNLALSVVLRPLVARFDAGERTDELYESMLNVE